MEHKRAIMRTKMKLTQRQEEETGRKKIGQTGSKLERPTKYRGFKWTR